jgi:UDPglucose 6-dehydrogenase
MREVYPEIEYAESAAGALQDIAAALVVTNWDEEFEVMETPIVIDGRHAINRRDGIVYVGLTAVPARKPTDKPTPSPVGR